MKVINSKNTWYLIFGILFILVITLVVFNLIFKRTENRLKSTSPDQRETLITQKDESKSGITYIKASPKPTAKPSAKPLFALFNTSPKPTPSPSPTPNIKELKVEQDSVTASVTIDQKPTKGGMVASKSGDLELVDEDGVVYLSTKNQDGSEDSSVKKNRIGLSEIISPPPGYAQDLGAFINKLVRLSLVFASLLVFVQLVLGGIQWLTSGGDKGKVEEARNKITAAVVGLIIVASSYAVFTLVLQSLGIGDINALIESAFP
ncbi:MAG: hypothetical protein OEX81_03190 [Candidatus Pacebacteria bacterium]|nr:hypothetical protein [Candidatus Paceibacterota bacterium]